LTVPGLDQGCTVSAGITLARLDANFEMSKAISVADAQLYRAKENGRDQVMIAGHAAA
jgi:GGDEF domain-containing protein